MERTEWTSMLAPLLALALHFEGEGHYSLAKLARSAVDSLSRRAAYRQMAPMGRRELVKEIERVVGALSGLDVDEGLLAALGRGAKALAEGRLLMIDEAPHPYVCRTCGHMVLGEVTAKCPTCGAWPDTFQWFAPVYWLEALDPPAALHTLRQTPLDVAVLLEGLSEQAMNQQAPDGGWAIRNIISHLRDAQAVLDFRLDLFLKEEHPVLESKAIFEWATSDQDRPPSTLDIFADYQVLRAKIIARLESLPLAGWWRTGQHQEFGVVSLKQQVSYFAAHERTHLPQLERLRGC